MEILTNNENVSEVPASEEVVTENTETKESSSEENNKEINFPKRGTINLKKLNPEAYEKFLRLYKQRRKN